MDLRQQPDKFIHLLCFLCSTLYLCPSCCPQVYVGPKYLHSSYAVYILESLASIKSVLGEVFYPCIKVLFPLKYVIQQFPRV